MEEFDSLRSLAIDLLTTSTGIDLPGDFCLSLQMLSV